MVHRSTQALPERARLARPRRTGPPNRFLLPLLLALGCAGPAVVDAPPRRPHVVLVLADDLGWGDVSALHPAGGLTTPSLDRLAGQGRTFTDAHSPSAVCTPTRYALLTGRSAWRTHLRRGVLVGTSPPLIEQDRPTLATLLGRSGYRSACVGKWHLGLGWAHDADGEIDFHRPLDDTPVHHGFDSFFGIPASLDFEPYVYLRDDRVTEPVVRDQPASAFPSFLRRGRRGADLVPVDVLDRLVREGLEFLQAGAEGDPPLFLYLPLTAPHKPVLPHPRHRGASGLGPYGDFVLQIDAAVGTLLDGIERAGLADDTLVIVTSDNGSFMHSRPELPDHVSDETVQAFHPDHHRSNGPWRGTKADIWEAGHRVPLIVRWPGVVPAGTRDDTPVGLIDLYATLAEITGQPLADGEAEDSWSLLPLLRARTPQAPRPPLIHHSVNGMFALRDGPWKLVLGDGSGGREQPAGEVFGEPYQLYDLMSDPGETRDLAATRPDRLAVMTELFDRWTGVPRP